MNSHILDATALFDTGEVSIERSLKALGFDLDQFIDNHKRGFWGTITPNIHAENMKSIGLGVGQVFSRFKYNGELIMIITHMKPQANQDTLTVVISRTGINSMKSILPNDLLP